jgi:hypothetical protein
MRRRPSRETSGCFEGQRRARDTSDRGGPRHAEQVEGFRKKPTESIETVLPLLVALPEACLPNRQFSCDPLSWRAES